MGGVLTLNAGSSSVKFAVFAATSDLDEELRGQIEGIGGAPRLSLRRAGTTVTQREVPGDEAADQASAVAYVLRVLGDEIGVSCPAAVGHRIVHGGPDHDAPAVLDAALRAELEGLIPLAPLHQPHNLAGVSAAEDAFPEAVQIACFDTAFHRAHPWVADTFGLPTEYYDDGVRRYGFHGLAYESAKDSLRRTAPDLARGRVIVAHLGNGASMCAIREGKSVSSSMGFTALDGLPMGTRCGQLDPGVVLYLMAERGMSLQEVERLLYHDSGLKGLSGLSHDMRELEASGAASAARAIDYFVHRIRREIGAQAALLGGLDLLAFSGGIGENSCYIRQRVCGGFDWLGLGIDKDLNAQGAGMIAAPGSSVAVAVLRCDEERVIAGHCLRALEARDETA